MLDETSATPDYTLGFSDKIVEVLQTYSVESQAAHLLPHLRNGLRVLDFGCGPGTISVGLAKAVEPDGELHGIDMEESHIQLARRIAQAGGHANATFHVGDVTNMPFEDAFFDVAHCHSVLTFIPDTQAALAEVKRVMKPGGIISCREMASGSSFLYPDSGLIRRGLDMFEDVISYDEGHPQMGRELKGHLLQAGFEDIRATASFDSYGSPEEIALIYSITVDWFLRLDILERVMRYSATTDRLWEDIESAFDKWKDLPNAFAAIGFGEVIARKP